MLVYLVRHGQSAGNIPGLHGGANPDLSDIGKAQAEATGDALAGAGIATIMSSPLTRALRTAHLIATPLGATVEAWPDLAEADRKAWKVLKKERSAASRAGLTADEVAERFPGTRLVGFSGDQTWWLEQGREGRKGTYRRAEKVIRQIRKRWAARDGEFARRTRKRIRIADSRDGAIALVTHGAFGSVLVAALVEAAPTDYNRFSQYNCGISLVEISGKETRLRFLNRTDHLQPDLHTDLT